MVNHNPFGYIEVNTEDFPKLVEILLKNGYDVLCRQDGESLDVVMIDFVNPDYAEECFLHSHNHYKEED